MSGRALSLAFEDWPMPDQRRWARALAPASSFYDDGGAAERRSSQGLIKVARGYGVWLAFLARRGELDATASPAERVIPARLDAWIDEQRARGVRDSTIGSRLRDLHSILLLIEPEADVGFIVRPGGAGLKRVLPAVPKPFTIVESSELLRRALALFEAGRRGERYAGGAAAIRDAALLGLLAAHAPRIGSVAAMRIGTHLVQIPGGYRLIFTAADTKSRRPLSYDLHPALVPVFGTFLERARPRLGSSGTDLLWCGTRGRPLDGKQLSKIVVRRTTEWFGAGHGPHWFRKCLRSTAGRHSPQAALDAAEVLGHSPEVSVMYYLEAGSTPALRRHGQRIDNLRQRTRLLAERFYAERDGGGAGRPGYDQALSGEGDSKP